METTLKLIESEPERLSEGRVEDVIDAESAISLYKSTVIEPFEAQAADYEQRDLYTEESGLEIRVNRRFTKTGFSPRQVVESMRHMLETAAANHAHGKQMYGVKLFDETVTMDAAYLQEHLAGLNSAVVSQQEEVSVSHRSTKASKAAAAEIANTHAGRLTTVGYEAPEFDMPPTQDQARLYVAAVEQVDRLSGIVKEFKDELKEQADMDAGMTIWHTIPIGDYVATVKSVPREEPLYKEARVEVEEILDEVVQLGTEIVDNETVFYNTDLNEPRPYIAIEHLLDVIDMNVASTELKYRQSVSIARRRDPAVVLTLG